LLLEISSRRRRQTTYGLVGKRLLRVYAQPSGAATKRIGKDRSRPIKDDKRRGSGADRACKRWNIDVVNFPARPDAGHRAIRKTTAKKRRSGSACWRHMRSSWPGCSFLRMLGCIRRRSKSRRRRFCNGDERCVCFWRYYFLASATPRSCAGDSCELHVETDMNDFGTRAGGEAPEFGPGGIGPVLSELGAVVAASVVLGLAFLILS
jgi:hypothetical protein